MMLKQSKGISNVRNRITFESATQKVARLLAKQYHISVVFEGKVAKTDGEKIILPYFTDLSEELRLDMAGYIDHEVAHCKFTEFNLMAKCKTRFHAELLNATEDVRIEREMIKEFPGTAGHLRPLREKCKALVSEKMPSYPWPIRLMCAIQDEMYDETPVLDDEIKPYFDLIEEERKKLPGCASTLALFNTCQEIVDKVSKDAEKKRDKDEKSKDKKSKDKKGKDKKSKDKKSEDKKSEDKKSEDKKSEDGKKDIRDIDDSKRIEKALSEPNSDAPSDWDKIEDASELINKALEKENAFSEKKHIPFTTRYDIERDFSGKGDSALYQDIKREVSGVINPIKIGIEKIFKVRENAKWTLDRERGKINTRSLHKLNSVPGFRTPFKLLTKTETNNVAVYILADLSGSMRGRMWEMKKCIVAMSEALKGLNITFEVAGFEASDRYPRVPREFGYNRWNERLVHTIFKGFNSNNLTGIEKMREGLSNVDGESVRWAANRLAMCKQKRKILIVFSDGYPEAEGCKSILNSDLKSAISEIKKTGIECVGIGVQSSAVDRFYPESIVINNVGELTKKGMKTLAGLLLR